MDTGCKIPTSVSFGRFQVSPLRRELLADGRRVQIGGRAFDVLMALIEAGGSVVSKDALIERVWSDRVVEENNLQIQVSALRAVFGTDRDLIRTVAGRGYQFTGEIRVEGANEHAVLASMHHLAALPPNNLPEPVSELIGRDDELLEIRRREIYCGARRGSVAAPGQGATTDEADHWLARPAAGGPLREWVEGFRQLNRRSFIAFLGGALARSDDARSQEPRLPVIGFLHPGSSDQFAPLLDAFRQGLIDGGYVEGRNVAIEYRWADDQSARLPELAADLVRRRVSLIAATGGSRSAYAAKTATAKIPIPVLFIGGPDPVADGLVSSLNSPNGNLTGVAMKTSELTQKRLQLLLELIPGATKIALLLNPNGVDADAVAKDFKATTRTFDRQPILLKASSESDLEAAFVSAAQQPADGLLVGADAFFTNRRSQIVALAARHALPAGYGWREFVEAGGLVSYGPSIAWAYRQIGQYASRILKGQKPGDLPVQQPTQFEFVINLKTAKALGLNLPPTLLAVADEVIE